MSNSKIDAIKTEGLDRGMLVLVGGLLLRLVATLISLCGAGLSNREKVFMTLAWLPKTTVLGSVLLDLSLKYEAEQFYKTGEQGLSLSIISTILTVPLGSLAMTLMGPYLHTEDSQGIHQNQDTRKFNEEASIPQERNKEYM